MKILIVEDEIYLAQSISSRLIDLGYYCETATTVKSALKDSYYDAVLLSTNISGQNFYPVLEKFQNSIIILLVSYISNDTVSNPLKAGANDYILKPFMMEELVRKLTHLQDYERLKKENETFNEYTRYLFKNINYEPLTKKSSFPVAIRTNYQKYADYMVFEFAKNNQVLFDFISLDSEDFIQKCQDANDHTVIYLVNYHNLKKSDKQKVCEIIKNKKAIIATTDPSDEFDFEVIECINENRGFDSTDILAIDEYVQYIIKNFQNKFPDTELSKKLGISRKSLWEKRKKYGINKKK
jgi:DNA-binding NtrC family response regulator